MSSCRGIYDFDKRMKNGMDKGWKRWGINHEDYGVRDPIVARHNFLNYFAPWNPNNIIKSFLARDERGEKNFILDCNSNLRKKLAIGAFWMMKDTLYERLLNRWLWWILVCLDMIGDFWYSFWNNGNTLQACEKLLYWTVFYIHFLALKPITYSQRGL